MQPYQPYNEAYPSPPRAIAGPHRVRANWWLRLTSWGAGENFARLDDRERARRSRLASWLVLGLLAFEALLTPAGSAISTTLIAVAVAFFGTAFVAVFVNRPGYVNAAGIALIVLFWTALVGAIVGAPNGELDTVYLPAYDLFAIPVVIAAIVVRPRWVTWAVVASNCFIILADFALQPHVGDLSHWLSIEGPVPLLARPIALQLIVGTAAYLFARSTDDAIRRADRAEEIAELERREAERNRELEEGVRQLLEVHVRLANGDFHIRAQAIRNPLLWQIGNSLNNLISRLSRFAQADFLLRRTQEEARRLNEAIYAYLSGRPPQWPAPSQTVIDPITAALRNGLGSGGGTVQAPGPGIAAPPVSRMPPPQSGYPRSVPSQPAPTNEPLPDWLRPLMGQGDQQQARPPESPWPAVPLPQSPPPSASSSPWTLDPEANLPEWLRQIPNDDTNGDY